MSDERQPGLNLLRYSVHATMDYGDPIAILECADCVRFEVSVGYQNLASILATAEKHEQEAHR